MDKKKKVDQLIIGGQEILPGERLTIEIPVAPMYTHDTLSISVLVKRGKLPGPVLFVCAAIHGDEINGVEIIRRLLKNPVLSRLKGTLIAIPIVNVYGFIHHTRYLPDGRDLNRSFPGSPRGSLTSRLAHTFMQEIVAKSTHGIDLHTGARHRSNFPQIRADLDDEATMDLTRAFGAPLAINAKVRDGSLRQCASAMGVPVILYESCEALRFEETYIRAGERGILNVMRHLGMLRKSRAHPKPPVISQSTHWLRAPASGVLRVHVALGSEVVAGQVIGIIADPLGSTEVDVVASRGGIVIGRTNLPLVYEGDALFHLASLTTRAQWKVEEFHEAMAPTEQDSNPADPSTSPIAG